MTKMLLHSLSKLAIITNGQKRLEQCRKLNKLTFSLLLTLSLTFYVICNSVLLTAAPPKIGNRNLIGLYKKSISEIFFDSVEFESERSVLMDLPGCGCHKRVMRNRVPDPGVQIRNGTCSTESFVRGAGQKVIGNLNLPHLICTCL